MFWEKDNKSVELKAEIKKLKKEKTVLKEQVEDLKLKKKIDEEDIKHMIKIKEERLEVEFTKKEMNIEKTFETKVAELHNRYRDKTEADLKTQKNDVKDMYGEILKRLPDINVKLKGTV